MSKLYTHSLFFFPQKLGQILYAAGEREELGGEDARLRDPVERSLSTFVEVLLGAPGFLSLDGNWTAALEPLRPLPLLQPANGLGEALVDKAKSSADDDVPEDTQQKGAEARGRGTGDGGTLRGDGQAADKSHSAH